MNKDIDKSSVYNIDLKQLVKKNNWENLYDMVYSKDRHYKKYDNDFIDALIHRLVNEDILPDDEGKYNKKDYLNRLNKYCREK